jgi:hypothetical protein
MAERRQKQAFGTRACGSDRRFCPGNGSRRRKKIVRDSRKVPIEHLEPNPRNPRKTFTEKDLADLSESLKAKGIVQPILVRPAAGKANRFEIIAGERRWRAAQRAGLHERRSSSAT